MQPDTVSRLPALSDDGVELQRKFFWGLADRTRLQIVMLLLDGEKSVGELVRALRVPQARVSNHLACLKWCGYVAARREGKFIYYQVADPRVRELVQLASRIVADNAERIWACTRLEGPESK